MNTLKWLNLIKSRFGICSALMVIGAFAADYWTGPDVRLPVVSILPVVLAGWLGHFRTSLFIAMSAPALRLIVEVTVWRTSTLFLHAVVNALMYTAVFSVLSVLAYRAGLAKQLSERVRTLEGILPICAFCKRIRDADDRWHPIEGFITQRSEAQFSHGFCPDCARQHYGVDIED